MSLGYRLRGLARAVRDRIVEQRMARTRFSPPAGEPVLSFAGALPGPGALIHGGRVKLVHLRRRFAVDEERFNLLYMVSSAMPPAAMGHIRRARANGARLVWNQNGVAYPAWAGPAYEYTNAPMRRCFASADFVVFQSEFCRRSALRWLGPCAAPFAVVHNCVDTDAFRPAPGAVPGPEEGAPCRLLLAGTHQAPYRVRSALECLAALAARGFAARLTVAGRCHWPGGAEEAARDARELGVEGLVTFAPPFRQEDAPALYCAHHILLHTKYNDPCPTVPIEAMACGLPVVASRSGGLPELLGEEGGVLLPVPEDDYERDHAPEAGAMARAVEALAPRLGACGAAARARAVERFSATAWVSRHEDIFRRVLGGAAPNGKGSAGSAENAEARP